MYLTTCPSSWHAHHPYLLSFPTRRSSDLDVHVEVPDVLGRSMKDAAMTLARAGLRIQIEGTGFAVAQSPQPGTVLHEGDVVTVRDRKSTRLNSSHVKISYAVFCLKKKKRQ